MENIKTAVSIRKSLFEQAETLARKMKISRSRLFAIALEDFIREQENKDLLAKINAAYGNEPEETDTMLHRKARKTHRRIVEGQW